MHAMHGEGRVTPDELREHEIRHISADGIAHACDVKVYTTQHTAEGVDNSEVMAVETVCGIIYPSWARIPNLPVTCMACIAKGKT